MATLDSNKVTGVNVVSNANDAATKDYIENLIGYRIPPLSGNAGSFLSVTSNTPGVYWYARTVGSPYNINAVASGNGYYVAGDSAGIALYSTDTISWTRSTSSGFGSSAISSLAYYNGYFVAGGDNTVQNWRSLNTFASGFSSTADIRCATYGSSGFVIGGEGESVIWTLRTTPFAANAIYTSMYDGTNYWIGGASGFLATSTDSINWVLRTSGTTQRIGFTAGGTGLLYASGQTYPYVYGASSGVLASSTNSIVWVLRTSSSAGSLPEIIGLAFGNSTYVRTNNSGLVASSTDTISWTLRTAPITGILVFSTISSEYYVATNGFGGIITSTDAIVWVIRTSPVGVSLNQIIASNIYVVASGAGGAILTSTNAIIWTSRTSGITSNLFGLAYTSGTYVASGASGTTLYSTDAITWRLRTSGFTSQTSTFGNGVFIIGGVGATLSTTTASILATSGFGSRIATSPDGISWILRTTPSNMENTLLLTSSGSDYVASCVDYDNNFAGIIQSTDSVNWVLRTSGFSVRTANALMYYNGYYLLGGDNGIGSSTIQWTSRTAGTTSAINTSMYDGTNYWIGGAAGFLATSTDSINWVLRTSGTTLPIGWGGGGNGFVYNQDQSYPYVYCGYNASNINLKSSTDGIVWISRTAVLNTVTIAFGTLPTATYVTANVSGGLISTSTDTIVWVARTSGSIADLYHLYYSLGPIGQLEYYLNCRNSGVIQTSTNCIVWTNRTSGVASALYQLLYGDVYVVAGRFGVLNTSTNAVQWTLRTSGTAQNIYSLSYTSGTYIASGAAGTTLYSTDAIVWIARTSGFAGDIQTTTFGNGIFINGGVGATLFTTTPTTLTNSIGFGSPLVSSTDSISWSLRTTGANNNITALASRNNQYIASSINGLLNNTIIVSTDTITWTENASLGTTRINSLVYGNIYMASGNTGVLYTSTNTIVWTLRTTGETTNLTTLSYTPQGTYLLGTSGGIVRSSTDGITWISRTSGTTNAINQFANSSSTYIAAASSGTLLYGNSNTLSYLGNGGLVSASTNGIQWSLRTTCADIQSTTNLIAGGNYYLGCGLNYLSQSVLIASTDTINWVIRTTPFGTTVVNVLEYYATNNFTAGGNSGLLSTSTDSFVWILRTSAFGTNAINAVSYGSSIFVAAGISGILNTSTNGIQWVLRTSGFGTSSINALTYDSNSNYYIAASAGGAIRTSTDAITWSSRSSPTTNQLNSISNFGSYYLIGGNTSTLLASSTDTTQLKWVLSNPSNSGT